MPGFEVFDAEEFAEVKSVFDSGSVMFRHGFDHLRGDCYKVRDFEKEFSSYMNTPHALAVSSGTAALRVALAALGVGPGDEVITQSFTFVATVEAIIEAGAVPVCLDIDRYLNLDPSHLENAITDRTKAVIAVHMLGVPAAIREISAICSERGISLIEDTAWGCGGAVGDTKLGTFGDIGTFSFDFAKTMTTGEGGMLVFKSEEAFKRAAAWHDHGHENNPSVPRWEDTRSSSGFNFRMMELQGALGLAQLKKLDNIVMRQRHNRDLMWERIESVIGVEPRPMPQNSFDTADALVFMTESNSIARRCRDELLARGLGTKILPEAITWHFAGDWLHMPSLEGVNASGLRAKTPVFEPTRNLLNRAVAIPVSAGGVVSEDTLQRLEESIHEALRA